MNAFKRGARNYDSTRARRRGAKYATYLVALTMLMLALTLGVGSAAALDTPFVQDNYSFNVTRAAPLLTRICNVPVTRTDVRTYTVFTYADGSLLVVLNGANYTAFVGPGGTVTIRFAPNGDGTYLIEDQGNSGLNEVPGEGPIAGSAGRTVLIGTFNPATLGITPLQLISQTGLLPETQLAAMCPTLRG